MKNDTKMKRASRRIGGASPVSVVHFEFAHSNAKTVCLAADFNDWRPEATPMISCEGGRWIKELTLPPGAYEYCLVVDGDWIPDPLAAESVSNPFGGRNSVLKV